MIEMYKIMQGMDKVDRGKLFSLSRNIYLFIYLFYLYPAYLVARTTLGGLQQR